VQTCHVLSSYRLVLPVRSKEQANGLNVIQILLSTMGKHCQIKKKKTMTGIKMRWIFQM
jgi:hypothetical protein